jgi:bacillolysin
MKKKLLPLIFTILTFTLSAQVKPHLESIPPNPGAPRQAVDIPRLNFDRPGIPLQETRFGNSAANFRTLPPLIRPQTQTGHIEMTLAPDTGLPIFIKGVPQPEGLDLNDRAVLEAQCFRYMEQVKELLRIRNPEEEWTIISVEKDDLGWRHIRMQQMYQGVKVYGGEVVLHADDRVIRLFNGRYFPTPSVSVNTPTVSVEEAVRLVSEEVGPLKTLSPQELELLGGFQSRAELVVYHPGGELSGERLAWEVELAPSVASRWQCIIDAYTGQVLHKKSLLCKLIPHIHSTVEEYSDCPVPGPSIHREDGDEANAPYEEMPPNGPVTAQAVDLFGVTRTINTYEQNNVYFLIDASRNMHNAAQSSFPNDAVGVIWTINAQNTAPQNSNFSTVHVTSGNNTWSNPTSVSAHHHAGLVYKYFEDTFNRNSVNGQGGNIISLINVADEDGGAMDNAFWNGAAMFYGNGDQAFNAPLPKALDVTGHEFTHGVIQNTANLEYYGESGAINESMADVFGVLIDRNDWKLGEDVVNPAVFPSGALRDMANPHNGGNQLGDPGWQPHHVSEMYTGNQDNGGVHINSGIPNRAFFLFADAVGKDKAERVYYRALTQYLVRSSKFIDLRLAVLQAAQDLYGNTEVNAAANAFTTVGIIGAQGGDYQQDVEENPGEDFILYANANLSTLELASGAGEPVVNPLTNIAPLSRPSVTDDGGAAVYIATDKTMRAILFDWTGGTYNQVSVSNDPIWRNVAISRDGNRLAALTDDFDNRLYIFDLTQSPTAVQEFELYNPTSAQGVATGDVVFPDILEWDFSGEFLMYDALNRINQVSGPIEYWDISFMRAWNNSANNFGDGLTFKLFSGLPENTSVGNPTFAKNSPYVIAFDFLDEFNEEYYILGANIETGEVGTIFENFDLGFPNYSVQDDKIIFDAINTSSQRVIGVADLASDKINSVGNPVVLISGARWGVWFANGDRELTDAETLSLPGMEVRLFPNPFAETLSLEAEIVHAEEVRVEVFDLLGRHLFHREYTPGPGLWRESLPLTALVPGTYLVKITAGEGAVTRKVVKR